MATRSARLIGRRKEREAIGAVLTAARSGGSGVLVLQGEHGIGKSSLLDDAAFSAEGMRVLRVTGVESEMTMPFAGLHLLCSPLLDRLPDLPPAQRAALEASFGLGGSSAPDPFLVGLAALTLLSDDAETTPSLCLIDDVQWLDPMSADLMAFVARRLHADGVAMLFAMLGPSDRAPFHGLRFRWIGGVSRADARALLESIVRSPLHPDVAEHLLTAARGNPLVIRELAAELSNEQLGGGAPLPEPLPLGDRLTSLFLGRVRELPPASQLLLLIAAAEPTGDPGVVWRAATRLDVSEDALAPAEAASIVRVERSIAFRHPLIRSAIYRDAQPVERRRVHRALADATDPGDGDRRAWHAAAAAVGPDETVAGALEKSAGRARGRGGYAAAAALLERAAALSAAGSAGRVARLMAAAQSLLTAGQFRRAREIVGRIEAEPLTSFQQAQWGRLTAALALESGDGGSNWAILQDAAKAFAAVDARLARDTHLEALEAAIYEGQLGGPGTLREAARVARSAPSDPTSRSMPADGLLDGLTALFTDGHAAARPTLQRTMKSSRERGGLRWIGLAYIAAWELWDHESIYALAERRVRLARRAGALAVLPRALMQLGGYQALVGRFEAAEGCFAEAREIASATGSLGLMGLSDPAIITAAWRGQESRTRTLAEVSIRDSTMRGVGRLSSFAYHALGVLELGAGRYEAALEAIEEAVQDDLVATRALPDLVEAATRCGDVPAAIDAVDRIAESAEAAGTDWALGILARCKALLAQDGDAERLFQESIAFLRRSPVRPQLARSCLLFGEWLRRERRQRDARRALETAEQIFSSIGARAFAARAEAESQVTGRHARRKELGSLEELTPQEARIARLVSEGASNPEIAAELFISRRTVEYHLSHAFAKLGVNSRTQLARVMLEDPHAVH